ncbi:MAG: LysM peptidoglycan-binding domain-containing protein [Gammaproteobacteria bacterium]|nr:LysM peptidoglycan-binding domain-containing protein [Gammaproteobacteria bacterium]
MPKAYRLRLPMQDATWTRDLLAERLAPGEMFTAQRGPQRYRVQPGDTLALLAERYGVPIESLARLNRTRTSANLRPGKLISVPEAAPVTLAAATAPSPARLPLTSAAPNSAAPVAAAAAATVAPPSPGGAVPVAVAERESAEDAAAAAAARAAAKQRVAAATPQPVSAAQAEALGPALGPAADSEQSADPTDYGVSRDDTIRVAADETLGHYADWLGVSAARLREMNHLKFRAPVRIGARLKLDFRGATHETFEARRHTYHEQLQAAYFAAHRIVGTEVHVVRPGDSMWTLIQHAGQLPVWLLQQYNPAMDLAELHPGTQIVMPRVEEVASGG